MLPSKNRRTASCTTTTLFNEESTCCNLCTRSRKVQEPQGKRFERFNRASYSIVVTLPVLF